VSGLPTIKAGGDILTHKDGNHIRQQCTPINGTGSPKQKVSSGSGGAGRLRLMGKYIGHRLVARPEPDNTFWTASTLSSYWDSQ